MRREISFSEVTDSQRCYRQLLDSMARPGKINRLPQIEILPPENFNSASALVALSLLDADVTFYHADEKVVQYLSMNTSSSYAAVDQADFVFIQGTENGNIPGELKTGTLAYPEEGATLVIDTEMISATSLNNAMAIQLEGPGIETAQGVYTLGFDSSIVVSVSNQNTEFPKGIDIILTDRLHNILCIPRSSKISHI